MAAPENRPYSLLAKFYDEVLPGMSEMNRHARLKMLNGLMETIFHVAWTDQEIRQALRTVGFEKPLFQDGMDVRPPIPGAKRGYDAYYLTRKPLTPKLKH